MSTETCAVRDRASTAEDKWAKVDLLVALELAQDKVLRIRVKGFANDLASLQDIALEQEQVLFADEIASHVGKESVVVLCHGEIETGSEV